MVPHILFHDKDTSYFPNHTTWKCGKNIPSSGITQPPVLATILKKIIENNQLNDDQNSRILKILIKIKKYKPINIVNPTKPNSSAITANIKSVSVSGENSGEIEYPLQSLSQKYLLIQLQFLIV